MKFFLLVALIFSVSGLAYGYKHDLIPYRIDNKWGFVDRKKQVVIPIQYDEVDLFSEGYATVRIKGKYGYLNKIGKVAILAGYKEAYSFQKNLALVKNNSNKYLLIDKSGKIFKTLNYESCFPYKGYYKVWKNDKAGLLDQEGKVVINFIYDDIAQPSDDMIGVLKNGRWGFINFKNDLVIPYQYNMIGSFFEGHARVCNEANSPTFKKCGVINKGGILTVPFKYDWINDCTEGLCPASLNDVWGYIDTKGNIIIPFQYSHTKSFYEGLASVSYHTKSAYINKNGKNVIPYKYSNASFFENGLASVTLDQYTDINHGGYIDVEGNEYFIDTKPVIQFGIKLIGAKKSNFREAIKKTGILVTREDDSYLYDIYDPSSKIPDTTKMLVVYSSNENLAEVQYSISNFNNKNTVIELEKMLSSKYGKKIEYPEYNQWHYAGVVIRTTKEGPYRTSLSYRTIDYSVMEGEQYAAKKAKQSSEQQKQNTFF